MEAVQVQQVIARDGEILVTGLPYKRGQVVEIIVIPQPIPPQPSARLTVGRLRRSRLIGLWQDRDDIGDSSVYGPIPLGMCVRGVRGPSGVVTRRFPRSQATWESGRGRIRDVSTGVSVRADLAG